MMQGKKEEEVEEEEERGRTMYIVYTHISIDRWITLDILSHPDKNKEEEELIKIRKRRN